MPLTIAMLAWVFASADRGQNSIRTEDLLLSLDTLALPSVILALCAVDWSRLSAALGRGATGSAVVLAALVAAALSARVWYHGSDLGFGLGAASASSLVPAACFVSVLFGWLRWPRVVVTLGLTAALSQFFVSTVGPFSVWALGARVHPAPWLLFVQGGAAALMGAAFQALHDAPKVQPLSIARQFALVAVAVFALAALPPALNHGVIALSGASVWVLAGASFLGGRHWCGRGAIGVPLAILATVTAVAVGIEAQGNARALSSDLPTLPGVLFVYGLGGWLVARRSGGSRPAADGAAEAMPPIDLSAVARVVQAIDHGATLRAFGALLAPALVLWQLAGVGLLVDFGFRSSDGADDALPWALVAVLGSIFALWPLAFLLVDWMNRQDRLRVVSGLTGALLAMAGAAVAAAPLSASLANLLEDDESTAVRAAVVGLLLLGVATTGMWLLGRSRAFRVLVRLLAVFLALLVAAVGLGLFVTLLSDETGENRLEALGQVIALAILAAIQVAWWVRAIRLRLVLCEEHPRELLFGALPGGRFWVRVVALLGLPSSMWESAAFRQPAAWAFLLSRPIVYLGAPMAYAGLGTKRLLLLGAALIAAGHAAFVGGKRLAARSPWRPQEESDPRAPVLFLRSFKDDQFDFRRPAWQLRLRWFDLWSFRRNVDEAMVDQIAQYGPVVALGRPGEAAAPFGAQRYYPSHDAWQEAVVRTARRARAIVLVAGESPGLRWEFDLLRREQLLERTLLLLHPDPARSESNRRVLGWLLGEELLAQHLGSAGEAYPVALWHTPSGPRLLTVDKPSAAAYVVALRAHFQRPLPEAVASVLD